MGFNLAWDAVGEKTYELGVQRGVLYPQASDGTYPEGVVWNGLVNVTESPGGAEATDLYADNIKYASMRSAETFGGTIEAYMYPDEFMACDGAKEAAPGVYVGQQDRNMFGLCYRTEVGNDTATDKDDGYKLHLVYGCTASPSEKAYGTINDSPEAITFSWELSTTPVAIPGFKATASLVIDSRIAGADKMAVLEKILYGDDGVSTASAGITGYATGDEEDGTEISGPTTDTSAVKARLPLPSEVIALMATK